MDEGRTDDIWSSSQMPDTPGVRDASRAGSDDIEFEVSSLRRDAPPMNATTRHQRRRRYRAFASGTLVLLLLVGLGVLARPFFPRPTPPKPVPDPLGIPISDAGIQCVNGAAWSPDSRRVAVLSGCPDGAARGGTLTIFDVSQGPRPTHGAQIKLDPAVAAAVVPATVRQNAQQMAQVNISYLQLYWSPDGRQLATYFNANQNPPPTVSSPSTEQITQYGQGLVLVNIAAGQVRVLTAPPMPSQMPAQNGSPQWLAGRWDLQRGTVTPVPITPALGYRWNADDALVPVQPLGQGSRAAAPAAHPGPVGNPLGGNNFTIWQQGQIIYFSATPCPQSQPDATPMPVPYSPDDTYEAALSTTAWSPDGKYLISALFVAGTLPVHPAPPTSTPTLATDGSPSEQSSSCQNADPSFRQTRLPLRDAGVRAALSQIQQGTQNSVTLAWRPDGKRLAVAPDMMQTGQPVLTIYDCASGKVRAQFTAATMYSYALIGQPGGAPFSLMAWSPDSTRLLLMPEGSDAEPLIFGPKVLGG